MKSSFTPWRVLGLAAAFLLTNCGERKASDTPRAKDIPEFYGVYVWDGKAQPITGGEVQWRASGAPPFGGIIIHHQLIASGQAPLENVIRFRQGMPIKKEIEYVSDDIDGSYLRVAARPVNSLRYGDSAIALRIMPLEKPGAVLVVPAVPLSSGSVYSFEWAGQSYGFSVGAAGLDEVKTPAFDNVVISRSPEPVFDPRLAFARGAVTERGRDRVIMRTFLRSAEEGAQEASKSKADAQAAWEKGDLESAFPQAVIALGYHPDDPLLKSIVYEKPLTAARSAMDKSDLTAAERWAMIAWRYQETRGAALELLAEVTLTRAKASVSDHVSNGRWREARGVLNELPEPISRQAVAVALVQHVDLSEVQSALRSHMATKQWETAAQLARESRILTDAMKASWLQEIRSAASSDKNYFGGLFAPVWEVRLGQNGRRITGLRKVPGEQKLIVRLEDDRDEPLQYFSVDAQTGKVLDKKEIPAHAHLWSEDGRYGVYAEGENFQPSKVIVRDILAGEEVAAATRPWPASVTDAAVLAIHGGRQKFALALPGHDFAIEVIDLKSGDAKTIRIAGANSSKPSRWTSSTPFVCAMSFTSNGNTLVVSDKENIVRLIDVETGKQKGQGILVDDSSQAAALRLNDDEQRLCVWKDLVGMRFGHLQDLSPSSERIQLGDVILNRDWTVGAELPGIFIGPPRIDFVPVTKAGDSQKNPLETPFKVFAFAFDEQEHVFYAGGAEGHLARFAVAPDESRPAEDVSVPVDAALSERLAQFVLEHHKRKCAQDIEALMQHYAPQVDYLLEGNVGHPEIRADRQRFWNTYTTSTQEVKHLPKPVRVNSNTYHLRYPVMVDNAGPNKHVKASVEVYLVVRMEAPDRLVVIQEKVSVLRAD